MAETCAAVAEKRADVAEKRANDAEQREQEREEHVSARILKLEQKLERSLAKTEGSVLVEM